MQNGEPIYGVSDGGWRGLILGVLFAFFFCVPCVVATDAVVADHGASLGLDVFALLFDGIALAIIGLALSSLVQLVRFGTTYLEIDVHPVVPGTDLEGRVRFTRGVRAGDTFKLTVHAVDSKTHSSKHASTKQKGLFTHELHVAAADDDGSTIVPLKMRLPGDAPPTSTTADDRIDWQVWARKTSGAGFFATYGFTVTHGPASHEHGSRSRS